MRSLLFLKNTTSRFLSSCAYALMETLRRTALVAGRSNAAPFYGTSIAKAQCSTIRVKLFKIVAVVTEREREQCDLQSVRRILFSMADFCPARELWMLVFGRLQVLPDVRLG